MKNLLKTFVAVLVCSLVVVACDNDDDPKPVKLTKIEYTKNTVTVTAKAAHTGEAIKVTPSNAKATYTIKSITKAGAAFTNPTNGFKIATDGKISLAKDNVITAAKYVITVEATDKYDKEVKKTATYTVTIN